MRAQEGRMRKVTWPVEMYVGTGRADGHEARKQA